MIESFKETWDKIQQDPPGKRFRRQYRRRQAARESIINRLLFIGMGLVSILVGITMLFTPGPGIFFIFLGWGLVAQESLWLSILLDKFELYLRKWVDWGKEKWDGSSTMLKVLMITAVFVITALALYGAYLAFLT